MTSTLQTTDVAKLVRKYLKHALAGIKVSVRKDGYASIYVDVPKSVSEEKYREIVKVLDGYQNGGFDGMIDMQYSSTSWLYNDILTHANCKGTEASRGSVPGYNHPAPHPDATEVSLATRYIQVTRRDF